MFKKKYKNQTNELFSIVKRDIINCLVINKYKYVIISLLFVLFCFYFKMYYVSQFNSGYVKNSASYADIVFFVFRGMKVFVPSPGIKFEIPVTWLGCQAFLTWLIGNYITRDFASYGQQYLYRSTHKSYWIIGKIVYCIICVSLFYLIGWVTIFLFSLISCNPSLMLHFDVCAYVSEINIELLDTVDVVLGVVILPVITSIVLSFAQMTLTLWIKPIYSIIVVIAYSCASAYYFSYVFIGNYSMILRSSKIIASNSFVTANGIEPKLAIAINLCLIIILIIACNFKLKKFDYIEKS